MNDTKDKEPEVTDWKTFLRQEEKNRKKQLMTQEVPKERTIMQMLLTLPEETLDDIRYNLDLPEASWPSSDKPKLLEEMAFAIVEFSHRWLPSLLEDQYQIFRYFLQHDGITTDFRANDQRLDYLRGLGFLAAGSKEGKLAWYMPTEMQEEFRKLDSPDFQLAATTNSEIARLASGLLFYYGYLDYGQLYHMVNKYLEKSQKIDFFAFMGIMLNASCWQNHIVGLPHGMHYYTVINAEKLEKQLAHRHMDFAELTYQQVYDAGEENYIEATDEYKALAQFLMQRYGLDVLSAANIVGEITIMLQNDGSLQNATKYLEQQHLLEDEGAVDELTRLLIAFSNTTRMWLLKGNTPAELIQKAPQKKSNVIDFDPNRTRRK